MASYPCKTQVFLPTKAYVTDLTQSSGGLSSNSWTYTSAPAPSSGLAECELKDSGFQVGDAGDEVFVVSSLTVEPLSWRRYRGRNRPRLRASGLQALAGVVGFVAEVTVEKIQQLVRSLSLQLAGRVLVEKGSLATSRLGLKPWWTSRFYMSIEVSALSSWRLRRRPQLLLDVCGTWLKYGLARGVRVVLACS